MATVDCKLRKGLSEDLLFKLRHGGWGAIQVKSRRKNILGKGNSAKAFRPCINIVGEGWNIFGFGITSDHLLEKDWGDVLVIRQSFQLVLVLF